MDKAQFRDYIIEELKEPFQLFCRGKNKIIFVCFSVQCQQISLHCSSVQCKYCFKSHQECQNIYFFQVWEQILKQKAKTFSIFLEEFLLLDEQLKHQMCQPRKQLKQVVSFGWTGKDRMEKLKEVYCKKNPYCLIGRQANQIQKFLYTQTIKQKKNNLKEGIFKQFVEKSQTFIEKLHQLKSEAIMALALDKTKFKIQSKIISYINGDVELLSTWLSNPFKIQLLFRASDHGFSSKKFHYHCDDIPHTLVIAKTEFNKIIGGYTHLKWNHAESKFVQDKLGTSFIFSLSFRTKMILNKPKSAIYCYREYGPTFGYGFDMHICNDCNIYNKSYSNFPYSYKFKSEKTDQKSLRALLGCSEGKYFKVIDYEVFKVSWK